MESIIFKTAMWNKKKSYPFGQNFFDELQTMVNRKKSSGWMMLMEIYEKLKQLASKDYNLHNFFFIFY